MDKLFIKKKIVAILSVLVLLFPGGLLLKPKTAEAVVVPVGDLVNFEFHAFGQLKEQGLDAVVWALGRETVNALIARTLEWINTGFDGNPAFVQNPLSFVRGIQDETAINFFNQKQLELSNTPFGDAVVSSLIHQYANSYDGTSYDLDSYTGSRANSEAFLSGEFSKGGWDAWFATARNPQNTFLGSYVEGIGEREAETNKRLASEFEKLRWGDGFQSVEDASGNILTPGSIIKSQLEDVLGSGLRSLENADELSELIGALVGTLTNNILSGDGLAGTVRDISGESSLVDRLREVTAEGVIDGQSINDFLLERAQNSQVYELPEPEETPSSGN